tara:strand:- start:1198 stop:1599 length:402 start_codon:yes stop_codon:yes gene_type:complete
MTTKIANGENKMSEPIFEGKTFEDLSKDIYENSKKKRNQIEILIKEMNKMITSIDDVILLAPIIKEYLEVGVKNDEQLVKLASIVQRIITKSTGKTDDSLVLSDSEKQELIDTLQETADELQNFNDNKTSIGN